MFSDVTQQPPQSSSAQSHWPDLCTLLGSQALPGRAAQSREIIRLLLSPASERPKGALGTLGVLCAHSGSEWRSCWRGLRGITGSPGTWPSLALAFALSHMVGLSRLYCLHWEQFLPATCSPCSLSKNRESPSIMP